MCIPQNKPCLLVCHRKQFYELNSSDQPLLPISLITFLHYFLAAVHKLYPDSCLKTEALISNPVPCSRDEIAEELINNLSGIELPFGVN
jgi:hypothetical protein